MDENRTELLNRFSKLQWMLHKLQMRKSVENGPMADTTRGQGRILAILKLKDGISTKDLSYLLGIRVSSLNELLAKMEKAEYLTREPSEADKRVMLVRLTEKGKSEQQQEWNPEDIFACLSDEEREAFSEYLDKVILAIEAEIGTEADDDAREWWTHGGRERLGNEMFEHFASMGFGHSGHRCGMEGAERPEDFREFPHHRRHMGRPGTPPHRGRQETPPLHGESHEAEE